MRPRPTLAIAIALLAAVLAVAAPTALASYQWTDGVIQESTITNCASIIFGNPYSEAGAGAYVGAYVDPNNLPHVGDTYYGHTVVAGVGDPCAGTYAHLEVAPPRSSTFAVTSGTPVFCYLGQLGQNGTRDTTDCPAAPTSGIYGGSAFNPTTRNDAVWPLPQGYFVEVQFPLTSSASLTGIGHNPCDCLTGLTKILDGNASPLLTTTEGIFVQPGAPTGGGGGTPGGGTTTSQPPASGTGGGGSQTTTPTTTTQPPPQQPGTVVADSTPTASAAKAPRSIRLALATKRGIAVAFKNAYAGSTDVITVQGTTGPVRSLREAKARTVRLGRMTKKNARAGAVSYKVKLKKSAAKRVLGKHRGVSIQLLITVSAPGHNPTTLARKITLKR
jgi:hypothetical protein